MRLSGEVLSQFYEESLKSEAERICFAQDIRPNQNILKVQFGIIVLNWLQVADFEVDQYLMLHYISILKMKSKIDL